MKGPQIESYGVWSVKRSHYRPVRVWASDRAEAEEQPQAEGVLGTDSDLYRIRVRMRRKMRGRRNSS